MNVAEGQTNDHLDAAAAAAPHRGTLEEHKPSDDALKRIQNHQFVSKHFFSS